MVDSKYSTGEYKPSKISNRDVMKNPEMLKLVPDCLKTKQMCNYAVKKLPFVIRYVPNRYATLRMCNKDILKMVERKSLFLIDIRLKKCDIKLLIIMH